MSLNATDTSTPIPSVTSPRFSPAVTYRATSMKRKGKRTNSELVPHQGSTASVDSDSLTSEYYSSTSLSENNPTKSFSTVSGEEERTVKDKKLESNSDSPTTNCSSISLQISEVDGDPSSQQQTKETVAVLNDGRFLETPLQKGAARRERSVPTETQTLQRDEVRMRKTRKRFASETLDNNRHSADIESLLRLTAFSQGKHDGLGNVLNTQQVKLKLKRQSTIEKGQEVSLSQPTDHLSVTRSANSTPPCVQADHERFGASHEVIHMQELSSPTNSTTTDRGIHDYISAEQFIARPQSSEPKLSSLEPGPESLPAIKRTYHSENKSDLASSLKLQQLQASLDKAALFESIGSSSTASMLYPPSSVSTSLDSSFSSDHTSLSNNKGVDDDNLSDSRCTTPTSDTPTGTREGTPSPDPQSPLYNSSAKVRTNKQEDANNRNARHTFNKSNFDSSRGKNKILKNSSLIVLLVLVSYLL